MLISPQLPTGPLVSPPVAADLSGMPLPRLELLIRSGEVRAERIEGKTFVDLSEVERLAQEGGER